MEKETALKILRERHDKALFSERTALETLIPELNESENEQIKRFINNELACLRAIEKKDSLRYELLTNAIAWLKEQAEQK